ncbi:hypothetical protein AcW1_006530 [Taiwanofungus camphoratus]|nr:hypothetical protein AcW1_006530 [Antrodia cinnamomea]
MVCYIPLFSRPERRRVARARSRRCALANIYVRHLSTQHIFEYTVPVKENTANMYPKATLCGHAHFKLYHEPFKREAAHPLAPGRLPPRFVLLSSPNTESKDTVMSTHPQTPEITDAPPPFDKPAADIILRSSDLVDFRVRKCILAEASPFFESMFNLPQPVTSTLRSAGNKDGLSVITMPEDSSTLDKLLRICYPVRNPKIQDIDELRPLLDAAIKYDVTEASDVAKGLLCAFAETTPLRAYAISLQCKLERETRIAARCFLNYPIVEDECATELEEVSGAAYHRLLRYHRRCGQVASKITSELHWIRTYHWVFMDGDCSCKTDSVILYSWRHLSTKKWWEDDMRGRTARLLAERPSGKALLTPEYMKEAEEGAMSCDHCKSWARDSQLRAFTQIFAEEVDKATSKIELEIKF